METCLRKALSANPELSLAHWDVEITRRRKKAAAVGLLPAVSLKAEETRGRADQPLQTPSFLERLYGVQATQTLFQGGKKWALYQESLHSFRAQTLRLNQKNHALRYEVEEVYWKLAALETNRSVLEETHRLLQEDLEKAARHELSRSRHARIELLSARAQSRECELRLAENREESFAARARLLSLMGLNSNGDFQTLPIRTASPVAVDENESVRLALAHRPEIALAPREKDAAQWNARARAGAYYPRLDLNGFYGRSGAAFDQTEPFQYEKDWNAGLKLSWALWGNTAGYSAAKGKTSPKLGESARTETETHAVEFTLGDSVYNAVETAEGQKEYRREQGRADTVRRRVEEDVRLACRKLFSAWKRIETAKARLEQSLQEFTDTRHLLQDDRAHLGDLAAARNRIATARLVQHDAWADYRAALSNLNRAVGIPAHFRMEDSVTE